MELSRVYPDGNGFTPPVIPKVNISLFGGRTLSDSRMLPHNKTRISRFRFNPKGRSKKAPGILQPTESREDSVEKLKDLEPSLVLPSHGFTMKAKN
jgi:hypothetical protein